MSMNLVGKIKADNGRIYFIEFPFQTPTSITEKVLKTKDNKTKMSIIQDYLESQEIDPEMRDIWLDEAKDMIFDENLTLASI